MDVTALHYNSAQFPPPTKSEKGTTGYDTANYHFLGLLQGLVGQPRPSHVCLYFTESAALAALFCGRFLLVAAPKQPGTSEVLHGFDSAP
jgi:hypothetical protein